MRWHIQALQDLREYATTLGYESQDTEERLRTGAVSLRDKWLTGSKDPETYYRDEVQEDYLFDLTAWHGSGTINSWFETVIECLKRMNPGRLLDFGAGIGTYSLIAASLGWEVDACDLNRTNLGYTSWRSAKHNLPITVTTKPSGTYDCIICIDTIEHLQEPEAFPAYAKSILNDPGHLIATWTFHQSGGMHPMHHTENRLSGFLQNLKQHFAIAADTWPVLLRR